ncbi:MAG TPA: glycosyltransferase [Acidobacteriota bacterium]|nr:glycosyltransferase [Acidobacteriota bacterium]
MDSTESPTRELSVSSDNGETHQAALAEIERLQPPSPPGTAPAAPVFPCEKPDRRKRARARPDYTERRKGPRYECRFPVNLHITRNGRRQVLTGWAHDISDGGLLLKIDPAKSGLEDRSAVGISIGDRPVQVDFRIPEGVMPEEYLHGRQRLNGRVRERDLQSGFVAVVFDESLADRLRRTSWFVLRALAVAGIALTVVVIALLRLENVCHFWLDVPVFLYSLCVGIYLLSRFLFAALYRPPKPRSDLPKVSVIVPAFNEERYIERTLTSILESAYPSDLLEVIVVNDCSSDRTLDAALRVADKYPEIKVLDLRQRSGKRRALASGTRISTGEVVVFVDSDSFLRPDALRHIVDGLSDPAVGAVCGHCEVENKWTNLLTRMQAVRYFIGFRVIKAAESLFGMNSCLSGPFAAYRRSVLLEVLDAWVHQRYLGRPATYGDDRSLTNMVLKKHKVLYDSRAKAATIVPETYRQFLLQQARWKRSWFRESVKALTFMWRKPVLGALSFYLGFLLPILAPLIVFRAVVYLPLFYGISPLNYIGGIVLMATLMSTSYLLVQRSRLWLYGVPFCLFYMFVLVWQLPWTTLTYFQSSWGTRG